MSARFALAAAVLFAACAVCATAEALACPGDGCAPNATIPQLNGRLVSPHYDAPITIDAGENIDQKEMQPVRYEKHGHVVVEEWRDAAEKEAALQQQREQLAKDGIDDDSAEKCECLRQGSSNMVDCSCAKETSRLRRILAQKTQHEQELLQSNTQSDDGDDGDSPPVSPSVGVEADEAKASNFNASRFQLPVNCDCPDDVPIDQCGCLDGHVQEAEDVSRTNGDGRRSGNSSASDCGCSSSDSSCDCERQRLVEKIKQVEAHIEQLEAARNASASDSDNDDKEEDELKQLDRSIQEEEEQVAERKASEHATDNVDDAVSAAADELEDIGSWQEFSGEQDRAQSQSSEEEAVRGMEQVEQEIRVLDADAERSRTGGDLYRAEVVTSQLREKDKQKLAMKAEVELASAQKLAAAARARTGVALRELGQFARVATAPERRAEESAKRRDKEFAEAEADAYVARWKKIKAALERRLAEWDQVKQDTDRLQGNDEKLAADAAAEKIHWRVANDTNEQAANFSRHAVEREIAAGRDREQAEADVNRIVNAQKMVVDEEEELEENNDEEDDENRPDDMSRMEKDAEDKIQEGEDMIKEAKSDLDEALAEKKVAEAAIAEKMQRARSAKTKKLRLQLLEEKMQLERDAEANEADIKYAKSKIEVGEALKKQGIAAQKIAHLTRSLRVQGGKSAGGSNATLPQLEDEEAAAKSEKERALAELHLQSAIKHKFKAEKAKLLALQQQINAGPSSNGDPKARAAAEQKRQVAEEAATKQLDESRRELVLSAAHKQKFDQAEAQKSRDGGNLKSSEQEQEETLEEERRERAADVSQIKAEESGKADPSTDRVLQEVEQLASNGSPRNSTGANDDEGNSTSATNSTGKTQLHELTQRLEEVRKERQEAEEDELEKEREEEDARKDSDEKAARLKKAEREVASAQRQEKDAELRQIAKEIDVLKAEERGDDSAQRVEESKLAVARAEVAERQAQVREKERAAEVERDRMSGDKTQGKIDEAIRQTAAAQMQMKLVERQIEEARSRAVAAQADGDKGAADKAAADIAALERELRKKAAVASSAAEDEAEVKDEAQRLSAAAANRTKGDSGATIQEMEQEEIKDREKEVANEMKADTAKLSKRSKELAAAKAEEHRISKELADAVKNDQTDRIPSLKSALIDAEEKVKAKTEEVKRQSDKVKKEVKKEDQLQSEEDALQREGQSALTDGQQISKAEKAKILKSMLKKIMGKKSKEFFY